VVHRDANAGDDLFTAYQAARLFGMIAPGTPGPFDIKVLALDKVRGRALGRDEGVPWGGTRACLGGTRECLGERRGRALGGDDGVLWGGTRAYLGRGRGWCRTICQVHVSICA